MLISYIYNSCIVLEDDEVTMVFDFYKDTTGFKAKGLLNDEIIPRAKKLYIFSSHSHNDHYNEKVLQWNEYNTVYILSDDIYVKNKDKYNIYFLKKNETFKDGFISVKAFGSTDIGISFFVKYKNKNIFHAGDLNNWHWNEEATEEEIKESEDFYLSELEDIQKEIKNLDILVYPTDPRLGKDYDKGIKQFLDLIKTDLFIPIHFGGEFDFLKGLNYYFTEKNIKYIKWNNYGDSIVI